MKMSDRDLFEEAFKYSLFAPLIVERGIWMSLNISFPKLRVLK